MRQDAPRARHLMCEKHHDGLFFFMGTPSPPAKSAYVDETRLPKRTLYRIDPPTVVIFLRAGQL